MELKDPPSPIELLPGAHRLRFELPGKQPVNVALHAGEGREESHRTRALRAAELATSRACDPARIPTRPVPASTYWLSAGALAAFASSAAFLVSGLERARRRPRHLRSQLRSQHSHLDSGAPAPGGHRRAAPAWCSEDWRFTRTCGALSFSTGPRPPVPAVSANGAGCFVHLAGSVLMLRRSLVRSMIAAGWLCA